MSDINDRIVFKQLLKRHSKIVIPMIQRDYAQGRQSEQDVREEFLNTLERAILLPKDDEILPINLDFIYGSVEGASDKNFLPLDGQQRLTTLFLLHWYLAWKDSRFDEFKNIFRYKNESRFTYAVRRSSNDFFNQLVNYFPDENAEKVSNLRKLIINQPWFFLNWELDPTIHSCLGMLSALHDRFKSHEDSFSRLVDEVQPAITFQLLDLENFGLSDDLYIKMNARGKPLTAFETFKARYELDLQTLFSSETRKIGDHNFSYAEYFSRQMDGKWAEFFWSHRNGFTNLYDDAVMNLFRSVALLSRNLDDESFIRALELIRNRLQPPSYTVFHNEGWLDRQFSELLFTLLEVWTNPFFAGKTILPNIQYFDEVATIERMLKEPSRFSSTDLVQLMGYALYLKINADNLDPELFQEWMRVVFNLSTNTSYERPADIQRSLSGLEKILPNANNILEYIAHAEKPITGFSIPQIAEEQLKANLILANDQWRSLILRAENHGYFKGQIEFLLSFSGIKQLWTKVAEWSLEQHTQLQSKFKDCLIRAELMFNASGLKPLAGYKWERALLSIDDYLLPSGNALNFSFGINTATEQTSWKRLLRGVNSPQIVRGRDVLFSLLRQINLNVPLESQLDALIDNASNVQPWRKALIETPSAIAYCAQRLIRRCSEDKIYLLKKTQMNGAHAELYTFCLYEGFLKKMGLEGKLLPLKLNSYRSVNSIDEAPGIPLVYTGNTKSYEFFVKYVDAEFNVSINIDTLFDNEKLKVKLEQSANFQVSHHRLYINASMNEIQKVIVDLAVVLNSEQ